jgi:predicted membrane protein
MEYKNKTLFLSVLVVLVVYGLLYMMSTHWFWALLLALFAGWLFWYLCEKCETFDI